MPMYDYEILDSSGQPTGERCEVFQSIKEDAYQTIPGTGQPCRRAITLPRTERRFAGTETLSRRFGFDPDEVMAARQLFPDADIRDNGDVHFHTRSEGIKFANVYGEQLAREKAAQESADDGMHTED